MYAAVGGHPSRRALSALPSLPDGSSPRLVPLDDTISLVVADVPADIYSPEALEQRLTDPDWVSRCGAAHHAVSEALAKTVPVIPLRFLTLFSTEAKAVSAMKRSKAKLVKTIERVRGREEWVLRIGRPDPRRAAADPRATRASGSKGQSGSAFLRAKADARKLETERAHRVATDAMTVFETLREVADEATTRPVEPGLNLLVDAALLVKKRNGATLRRTLAAAAAGLLAEGCPVSLTGPWPPYSFAALGGKHG